MSKEEYLEMLYQKLNIPRQLLIKYIHSVGTNEENIKDYAMNASCAVVRKDNGFQIDYTAEMINNKDQKIDQLKQQLEEYKNKENTSAVNSLDEMLKNCDNCSLNECIGCEYTQTCVQNIKQQLAEKDEKIKELKKEISEWVGHKFVKLQYQKAIQKLEKVKDWLNEPFDEDGCFKIGGDLIDFIDQQINDLRGEKDAEG